MLEETAFVEPQMVLDIESIAVVTEYFKFDVAASNYEYRKLRYYIRDSGIDTSNKGTFWEKIRTMDDFKNVIEL